VNERQLRAAGFRLRYGMGQKVIKVSQVRGHEYARRLDEGCFLRRAEDRRRHRNTSTSLSV
jgi:hypothetical protein